MHPSEVYWSACYNAILWQIRYNLQNTAMTHRLPILLTLLLAATGVLTAVNSLHSQGGSNATRGATPPPPAATEGANVPQAKVLLEAAIRALDSRGSISARIRQQAKLFGHQLIGSGRYLESHRTLVPLIRLELTIEIAEHVTTSLVQVCDGRNLWTYRKLLSRESVSQIDAVRASDALKRLAVTIEPNSSTVVPGLGGLSRLLRGLDATFQFISAEKGRIDDLPVWKIEGGWKPAQLIKLLPNQKDAIEHGRPIDLSPLPEHLPDRVILLLGQEDLFPYRMDYCRFIVKKKDPVVVENRALMTVEFYEVNFNMPIDVRQFIYNPGVVEKIDQTEAFLESLGAGK